MKRLVGGVPAVQNPRRRLAVAGAVAAVLLLAGVGGGVYWVHRNADPAYRAEQLAQNGNPRGAVVELRNALRATPRDPVLHFRIGELQMHLADPVAAEKEFRIARAVGGDRAVIVPRLADALLAQGMFDETLKQVPASGPTADSTAKFLFRRCIAQLGLEDVKSAEASYELARRAAPDNIYVVLMAARLAAAHEDVAQTEARVDEVLKRDPTQIDALLMKQQMATARGDHPAALDLAGRAVQSAPWSAMAHIRHATELLFAKRDEEAKVDVDAVLSVQPRFIEAVYLRGILLARQGKFQDASVALNQLDQVSTRFPPALYYKALIAADLGQAETADNLARRYNVLVPKDPDGVRLAARSDMAVKDSTHAVAVLKRAIGGGMEDASIHDLLGSAQANLGDSAAALASFQHALKLAPDDPTILTHLGMAQVQAGYNADAAGTLTRTLEIAPTQPLAGEALVSAALGQNDPEKAAAALTRLRAQVGDTQQVGLFAGLIEVRRGHLDAARDLFADLMKRFPNSSEAKLDYARTLVQLGNRLDGMQAMSEVLAHDPADIPALNSYVALLVQDRQLDRAITVLDAAHAADPHQVGFTATLADALVLSGDAKRAVDVVQGARVDGVLPPMLLAAFGRAQAAAGMTDGAKTTLREAIKGAPNDLVDRAALIDLLLSNHEQDAAQAELLDALKVAPGNSRFLSTLVELQAQMHGLDAGLQLAEQLRADPSHLPYATLLRGDALMRARRYNAAARAYLDEYKADPEVPPLLRAVAALVAGGQSEDAAKLLREWVAKTPNTPIVIEQLAKLDISGGRLPTAQSELETLLTMLPNDVTALNNLAWIYQQLGDKRARPTAQRAYLQGAGADAADTLGWIMVTEHDAANALPLLRQAGSQLPNNADVQYHLAAALEANGQADEAAPILRTVLAQQPSFAERPNAEKLLSKLPAKLPTTGR